MTGLIKQWFTFVPSVNQPVLTFPVSFKEVCTATVMGVDDRSFETAIYSLNNTSIKVYTFIQGASTNVVVEKMCINVIGY